MISASRKATPPGRPAVERGRTPLWSTLTASVLTALAGQVSLILSGVIAARSLGPENRGNLALLVLIPTAISQLGSLGLPLAITYELSRDEERARGALENLRRPVARLTVGLIALHAAVLAVLVSSRAIDVQLAAAITLLVIPADTAQLYGLAILQGKRHFTAFNVLRLLPAVLYSALAAAAFLLGLNELPLFALWFAGSYALVGALTLMIALRRAPPQRNPAAPTPGAMLRFGARGLLGSASPLETLRLDQAFVGLFLSPAALGLYVVGVSFTNLPRLVAQSIGLVAYPHVTAERDPRRARRSMWRFLLLAIVASVAVIIPLALISGWVVPAFFGQAFAPAVGILQILLISALFLNARRVLTEASRGIGRPGLSTAAEVASWVSLVPGVLILAPRFGAAGVAAAFTISAGSSLAVLVALVAFNRTLGPTPSLVVSDEPTIDPI